MAECISILPVICRVRALASFSLRCASVDSPGALSDAEATQYSVAGGGRTLCAAAAVAGDSGDGKAEAIVATGGNKPGIFVVVSVSSDKR